MYRYMYIYIYMYIHINVRTYTYIYISSQISGTSSQIEFETGPALHCMTSQIDSSPFTQPAQAPQHKRSCGSRICCDVSRHFQID